MTNYEALLTLIGDINNAFCHLEDEDVADICDGDIKLLDKAVKRFKTTVWTSMVQAVYIQRTSVLKNKCHTLQPCT